MKKTQMMNQYCTISTTMHHVVDIQGFSAAVATVLARGTVIPLRKRWSIYLNAYTTPQHARKTRDENQKKGLPLLSMHENVRLLEVVLGPVALFCDKRPPIASLGVAGATKHYNTLLVLACWSGC